jgi:hypothetical protein
LESTLRSIYRNAGHLIPGDTPVLTSLVKKDDDAQPVQGIHSDVYLGQFGREKVALKRLRVMAPSLPEVYQASFYEDRAMYNDPSGPLQLFYRESNRWRKLRHPNVLSLYGIYARTMMVSPWIEMIAPVWLKNDADASASKLVSLFLRDDGPYAKFGIAVWRSLRPPIPAPTSSPSHSWRHPWR